MQAGEEAANITSVRRVSQGAAHYFGAENRAPHASNQPAVKSIRRDGLRSNFPPSHLEGTSVHA